ncbi:quinone oxidoreductase family protein [Gordonia aichiensis]|uniref:Enoyl reductase (ER) domain-containing protein n=1 Tax=Gordonia aichiensis NBRC 108223 TaxID=1220583 RepID=L7KSP6_9ACTN|nr:zinc-binding dehydrogenase [Gordonia aichiensis]GAC50748.1 hypothetical protein GOACH_29_00360 [Gordonia aichiensis NBRC 108223]
MRAARVHRWNTAPIVDTVADPTRGDGQSIVRIDAATVSHLDLTVATGSFDLVPPLPYVPGCEGSGSVLDSDTYPVGTQVIFRDGAVGLDRDGTWQERLAVADDSLIVLDQRLDAAVASTFFVPTTTAYVAVHDLGHVQQGQTVLVSGATGAVGSMVVQLARRAGAHVIALVSRRTRLPALPPGVEGIALEDTTATGRLALTRPGHVLIDTIGGPDVVERIGWVRPGGAAICVGYTAGAEVRLDLPNWLFTDVALVPVNLMNCEARALEIARKLLPQIAAGDIAIAVEEFDLERVATAVDRVARGAIAGRAVIRF